MIVKTEIRDIEWSELTPALQAAYEKGRVRGEAYKEYDISRLRLRSALMEVMKYIPYELRLDPLYFHLAGQFDGMWASSDRRRTVLQILAGTDSNTDENNLPMVAPVELYRLIADNFHGPITKIGK